jgi:ZIP family zinc transporter/zinc and cadmium transporter
MEERLPILILLGLTASLANICGGWIVSSQPRFRRTALNTFISLGAGFMLAAAILEVIPRSLGLSKLAGPAILGGYLFVHLVEHTVASHFHFGEETHADEIFGARAAWSALAGLALHAFFDGALIAAGFWVSMQLGILLFLAIFLHKIPEGFTAASIMRASGRSGAAVVGAAAAISISTLAGVVSIAWSYALVQTALPFSAGVTLYVAASDLIPEVNKEKGIKVSVGVFLGVVLFLVSEFLLGMFL